MDRMDLSKVIKVIISKETKFFGSTGDKYILMKKRRDEAVMK
jgi:hypothetical protein